MEEACVRINPVVKSGYESHESAYGNGRIIDNTMKEMRDDYVRKI